MGQPVGNRVGKRVGRRVRQLTEVTAEAVSLGLGGDGGGVQSLGLGGDGGGVSARIIAAVDSGLGGVKSPKFGKTCITPESGSVMTNSLVMDGGEAGGIVGRPAVWGKRGGVLTHDAGASTSSGDKVVVWGTRRGVLTHCAGTTL